MPHSWRALHSPASERLVEMLKGTILEEVTVRFKYRRGVEYKEKLQQMRAGQFRADQGLEEIAKKIIHGEPYKTQLIKYLRDNGGKREAKLLN